MQIPEELIARCQKRDPRAEHELYRVLYSFLMSICRRYVRQEEAAREVLNQGFLRLLTNIDKYRPVAPFHYWARKVMVNVIINAHRKEKVHYGNHSYVEYYNEDGKYAEINSAIEKFEIKRIAECVEQLPAASRQVFNLFIIDGYSHREISDMLNISEGTSKWHLNAAREKLKIMLSEKKTKHLIKND